MPIDIALVERIVEPVIGGLLLAFVLRLIERRPRVVVFVGNVGFFHLHPSPPGPGGDVHTHTVVIRNAGKLPAHNVRVPHKLSLATSNINVSVLPQTNYSVLPLPTGGDEILFPTLVPGQMVTISYLYYPPIVWNQIHEAVHSDEGMARELNVLPTPQLRPWQLRGLWALVIIGAMTSIYLIIELIRWLASLTHFI
jgi:uncharacterized repeat protein (TIGR01451 family)